jgi:hypothetical protein
VSKLCLSLSVAFKVLRCRRPVCSTTDGGDGRVAVCRRSLVALDELGRGTATMDGVAVASAVLNHVVERIGCRGIFATHYHVLADAWSHEQKQVSVKHMACEVEKNPEDPVPKVLLLLVCGTLDWMFVLY